MHKGNVSANCISKMSISYLEVCFPTGPFIYKIIITDWSILVIFCILSEIRIQFLLLYVNIQLLNTICWIDYSFPIELSWYPYKKLTHIYGLILECSVSSINCMPILMPVLYWLGYYSFLVNFEIGNHEFSNSVLIFHYYFGDSGSFHFQMNLRISLSISLKKRQLRLW